MRPRPTPQKNKGGDELGTLSVSFTVTETAPTPTPTPTPEPEPLTAAFQDMPDAHNGTDTFSFQILFSEAVNTSYSTLEDSALTVPDGEVTSASRVDGRSDLWRIVVRPDSDANVTVTLPVTQDCDADRRGLHRGREESCPPRCRTPSLGLNPKRHPLGLSRASPWWTPPTRRCWQP